MSMNSISSKLDLTRALDRLAEEGNSSGVDLKQLNDDSPYHQSASDPVETAPYDSEKTTVIEDISLRQLHEMRQAPADTIDLNQLKQRYEGTPGLGRRVAPRIAVEMAVVIFSPKASFRTKSQDISESGVLLKDLLPDSFMNMPLEILLTYEDPSAGRKNLLFYGEAVGGPHRSPRVIFKSAAPGTSEILQALLAEFTHIP